MIGGTAGKPAASLYVEADSSVVFSRPLSASELLDGQQQIFLRLTADTTSDDFHFSYSLDGKSYAPLGEPFAVQPGFERYPSGHLCLLSQRCGTTVITGPGLRTGPVRQLHLSP